MSDVHSIEVWTGAKGFEKFYEVSTHGNVRSLDRLYRNGSKMCLRKGRMLKLNCRKDGYRWVHMWRENGHTSMRLVHHVVLEAFVGEREPDQQCRHLDGSPSNNHLSNLKWGTASEDWQDKVRNGTAPFGENAHNAVLTWDTVRAMREEFARTKCRHKILAAKYGIAVSTVSPILLGLNWKEDRHVSQSE